jgi:hypothetical protein
MTTQTSTIVDPQQAYPPSPVVIDRPTDDLFEFVAACQELRHRVVDADEAQVDHACVTLGRQLAAEGRQVSAAALGEAARWQVVSELRRSADQELRGLHPSGQLLQDAEQHDDTVLYRRREQALALLLSDQAASPVRLVPEVLADRERACRQQALLVDEQTQLTNELARLRGVRGLLSHRRVRQLHADLAELDRQLHEVQAEIGHLQALLDAIHAADANRHAWLADHQHELLVGAAAVTVLMRRLLALANPPGCPQPIGEVDLDHPMGHDPLTPPPASSDGGRSAPNGSHARVVSAAAARAAASSPAPPSRQN